MDVMIGLEIHVQITSVNTKLFCGCKIRHGSEEPNTSICPVCLGLPGALPVVNRRAVEKAIMVALALKSKISPVLIFARKHYFYPDLPKNYQISQYDRGGLMPIAVGGYVEIEVGNDVKRVRIRRINIEEDPGRIVYPYGDMVRSPYSLVDYNRSGVPLLEIVTEPDMRSPEEARIFAEKLLAILEYLNVTDTSIEGAFRIDANVSVGNGARVEIKNIGSIKDLERALSYEIIRQKTLIAQGRQVVRETRHWDASKKITISVRRKEEEEDYRYFPDPDLPPITITPDLIERLARQMPELPDEKKKRFIEQYNLDSYRAGILSLNKFLSSIFEECAKVYKDYKKLADWLIVDFQRWIKDVGIDVARRNITPEKVVKLLQALDAGSITVKQAKEFVEYIVKQGKDLEELLRESGSALTDIAVIEAVVDEVLKENPKAVDDAKRNPKAINFLVGSVMKKTGGRADPKIVAEIIRRKLAQTESSS